VTVDGQTVKLQLWDTAGQERYRIITSSFYHNAHGTILVYDVGSKESFDNVVRWGQEVDRYIDSSLKVVVGNKCDLDSQVGLENDAAEVCDNIGASHHIVSAKTNKGVEEMFEATVRELLLAKSNEPEPVILETVGEANTNGAKAGCCVIS
jgi:small GTP-binding protein